MPIKTFPAPLLHAIDRWQKGGDHAAKVKRGQRLQKEVLALKDPGVRRCTETVYRRLALPQEQIWTFITTGALPEKISAWSLDSEIAKGLKGGVPDEWRDGKRWFGVILAHRPKPDEVVLNLDSLWVDLNYQRSLSEAGPEKYVEGIRRYQNSQREVVLDLMRVSLKDIWSWGGHSSSIEDLTELALGKKPTEEQIEEFCDLIKRHYTPTGPWWISSAGTRNVTQQVINQARNRGLPVPSDPALLP